MFLRWWTFKIALADPDLHQRWPPAADMFSQTIKPIKRKYCMDCPSMVNFQKYIGLPWPLSKMSLIRGHSFNNRTLWQFLFLISWNQSAISRQTRHGWSIRYHLSKLCPVTQHAAKIAINRQFIIQLKYAYLSQLSKIGSADTLVYSTSPRLLVTD